MKKQTLGVLAVIVALIAIIVLATAGMSRMDRQANLSGTSTVPGADISGGVRELCYEGSHTVIRAVLGSDGTVAGVLDFNPPEKDSLTGTFVGTWQASSMATGLDIEHSYAAEGVNSAERRLIVANDSYALIDWDGPGPIEISTDQIPKADCEQASGSYYQSKGII
ncbi:MAG TPA: hypothetical protein VGE62_00315 [Candidatus Paceibacterota bacterium]